eukprot:366399-Chlamydomonas_euryale.AAC.27
MKDSPGKLRMHTCMHPCTRACTAANMCLCTHRHTKSVFALPTITRPLTGTPAAAARFTACSLASDSCCRLLSSVPSTSVAMTRMVGRAGAAEPPDDALGTAARGMRCCGATAASSRSGSR